MRRNGWVRGTALIAALMLGTGVLLSGCGSGDDHAGIGSTAGNGSAQKDGGADSGQGSDQEGAQDAVLGDFEVEDLDGNTLTKADVLGENRVNMVNVWATWCGYCIEEMPDLQKLAEEYEDQGFGVVGILSDGVDLQNFDPNKGALTKMTENIDLAKQIVKEQKVGYPMIIPDITLVYEVLAGVNAYPTTFFTDQNGKLIGGIYQGVKDEKVWRDQIEALLKEQPQDPAQE